MYHMLMKTIFIFGGGGGGGNKTSRRKSLKVTASEIWMISVAFKIDLAMLPFLCMKSLLSFSSMSSACLCK